MKVKAILKPEEITVEAIPKMKPTSDAWAEWCRDRGLDPVWSGRRAWCDDARTYIRGADYLRWSGGRVVDVLHSDEIELL